MAAKKQIRRCDKCKWWYETTGSNGRCRANPPIKDKTWPMTYESDWCGKFIADVDMQQDIINAIRKADNPSSDGGMDEGLCKGAQVFPANRSESVSGCC